MVKMRIFLFYVVIIRLLTLDVNSQIKINEIVTSNSSYQDINANSPDWIELYNPTSNPINLKNYRISDKNDKSTAWILPNIIINPKSFQLLYASGENIVYDSIYTINASGYGINRHTNNDGFRFEYMEIDGNFKASVRLHSMRNTHEFSNAGLIIREKLTGGSKYAGLFSIAPERLYANYKFNYRSTENDYPARDYIGLDREFPYVFLEMERLEDTIYSRIIDSKGYCLIQHVDTVQINKKLYFGIAFGDSKNQLISCSFSNLYFNEKKIDFSSLNKIDINCAIEGSSDYFKEYHTDFKLEKDSGSIYLWNDKGDIADKLNYSTQKCDISYGRIPNGSENIRYFSNYTPGNANYDVFYQNIAKKPELNLKSGNYTHPISLEFINNNNDDIICYTLDGSTPNDSSFIYKNEPIEIIKNTVVRAVRKRNNYVISEIMNETFFINDKTSLPIIAVTIDSNDLYNKKNGLFTNLDIRFYAKPSYLEVFDTSHIKLYENGTESKLHGRAGATGEYQHSLRLYAKSQYGENTFKYDFWDVARDFDPDKIVLRNGGNSWGYAFINDAFTSELTKYIPNLIAMDNKFYSMYLNAEFYGLIQLQERFDTKYIANYYDIPENSIDYLENWEVLKAGNKYDYMDVKSKILDTCLFTSELEHYEYIDSVFDLDNLSKYMALQIFSHNADWPVNNRKFWKSPYYDNKWRWVIYDMDQSVFKHPASNYLYEFDIYAHSDNFYGATDILKLIYTMFDNKLYRNKLLNISADFANTLFLPDNLLPIFDEMLQTIQKEIPRQQQRWSEAVKNFDVEVANIRYFLTNRSKYFLENYVEYFKLDGLSNLNLSVYPAKGGSIKVNTITPINYPWVGTYFQNVPVQLTAIPEEGYRFVGWSSLKGTDSNIIVMLPDTIHIEAVFEKSANKNTLVINEIMYSPEELACGDWIEIYNKSDKSINLNNWIIKDADDDNIFTFNTDKYIEPDDFILVCEDIEDFRKVFPKVKNLIGPLGFGLSKKSDELRIYQPNNIIIDSVSYSTQNPWPTPKNSKGFSIELKHPDLNNNIGSNWSIANNFIGTPGEINTVYTSIDNNIDKKIALLYPLPAEEYIIIDDTELTASYFQLYDIEGNLIDTIIAIKNQKIDISNLSSGVYFLKNNKTTYKFIKR